MTPELIALLLAAPLPLRLALIDADKTGAGWMTYPEPDGIEPSAYLYQRRRDDGSRRIVDGGGAFLPCNPLAIAEHAARLCAKTAPGRDCWPHTSRAIGDKWVTHIKATGADGEVRVVHATEDKCPHTAAVALLREVVGG